MEKIIEANDLTFQIGHQYLLDHINWTVNRGDHWIIFGMNGCGKTTLLSIVAGFKPYSEGQLKIFGKEYDNQNILEIRKKIGFVSSSFFDKFFTKESVLDVVLSAKSGSFGMCWDINSEDIKQAKELLKEFHVISKKYRPFNTLSKGERQNVLLARALFNKPELILLDEPSAGLDIYARAHLLETIGQLAKNKDLTIVYVTHYTEEFISTFDKGMFLQNGCVYTQGKINELMNDELVSDFINYPVEIHKEDTYYTKINVMSNISKFQVV